MFEEATDNRAYANALRDARDPGPQTTRAAHDQVNFDARLRGAVERANDLRHSQCVHLRANFGRLSRARVFGLLFDPLDQALLQCKWALQDTLKLAHLTQAGQLQEELVDIFAELRPRREQAQVGVGAGRGRVVVARA